MTRRQWMGLGLFAACSFSSELGFADSMWDRRDPRSAYLFMDNRARRVGDTLTVIINENTNATNNEQRTLKKDTATSGKFNFAGKTGGTGGGKEASAAVNSDLSSNRSFEGSADYQSQRQLTDYMQATVVDVLPNGNLVIEGSRERTVSNETRWMRVTGVVRPNDIDIGNRINSQVIAHFRIKYEGGGVESRFTNQGWLGRVTNRVWPF